MKKKEDEKRENAVLFDVSCEHSNFIATSNGISLIFLPASLCMICCCCCFCIRRIIKSEETIEIDRIVGNILIVSKFVSIVLLFLLVLFLQIFTFLNVFFRFSLLNVREIFFEQTIYQCRTVLQCNGNITALCTSIVAFIIA